MSTNLFNQEMKNLENEGLHKPADLSVNKRNSNHKKLAARRAIEDHLEKRRLENEFGSEDDDLLMY